MGEWYEFDFVFDGHDYVAGCLFSNKSSFFNPRQMVLTDKQKKLANKWMEKQDKLNKEREELIMQFVKEELNPVDQMKER
jgi:predicted nuclease with TOPRIM domain